MARLPSPLRAQPELVSIVSPPDKHEQVASRERPRQTGRAKWVFVSLALLAAVSVGVTTLLGRDHESTDNAQVDGHVINVSARVSGQVVKVRVHDNQQVNQGEVLVELDRSIPETQVQGAQADLTAALAGLRSAQAQVALTRQNVAANLKQAQGGVAQAVAQLDSSAAGIEQARADLLAAQSRRTLAESELSRVKHLRGDGAGTPAELDTKQAAFEQAVAAVQQAQARLTGAQTATGNWKGSIKSAKGRLLAARSGPAQIEAAEAAAAQAAARVEQLKAALHLAELNLSYTTLTAPVRGVISRRTVEIGQAVTAGSPLLALVPLEDIWITANFKEDQIPSIRPGQAAQLHIDALPGRDFPGQVESIAGASGARFSLLPPENASGNFIKVVQRIPVLIRLGGQPEGLLPGMSANVTVLTRAR